MPGWYDRHIVPHIIRLGCGCTMLAEERRRVVPQARGRVLEFGMFNQKYAGRKYRYAYSSLAKPGWFLFNGYVKHDLQTGQSWEYKLGADQYGSEAPFAPRIGAKDEDDGYLVSFVIDEAKGTSECVLFDAKRITDGPVCRLGLPHKIMSGTHSCWASGEDIRSGLQSLPF